MSKHFGKTWWSQQWLNSLTNIDYSNRLPRGSSYARNGSVSSITINENAINAKVKGSRPKPYDVTIIIPPFFEPEIKKLIKSLAAKPVIISKLLNRELDAEILQIAENCGLKVFPKQWTDFKMQCSCPDWAVPCKHLAAVIYKVSEEIDNNPFLVFQLHRVDLAKELEKENIHIQQSGNEEIPMLSQLIKPAEKDAATKEKKTTKIKEEDVAPVQHNPLVFSTLNLIAEPLIQLLADQPVFYQNSGNFRDKYATTFRKGVRNAQRILSGKTLFSQYFGDLPVPTYKKTDKTISSTPVITHHTHLKLGLNANKELTILIDEKKSSVTMSQLMDALWQIPVAHLQDYQPATAALRNTLLMAVNLVANGAVVPQIVRLDNKKYTLRWLPALLSKEVKILTDNLALKLPNNILKLNTKEDVAHQTVIHLLSIFIDELMRKLSEPATGDLFVELFFTDRRFDFTAPGQESVPGGIYAWLQKYYLTQGNYKPIILVEEIKGDKFQIIINVQENNKQLGSPVSLREILTLGKYDKIRFEVLQSLAQLSSFIPGLDEYINSKGESLITMEMAKFAPFLMQAIPAIQLLNVDILLPKALQHILKPKASVRLKQKSSDGKSFLRLDKMLDFDWQVSVGDTIMSEDEFKKLLTKSEGLIKYKTNYIYVSPADMEKLQKHFTSTKQLSSFEMLRIALGNDYYGANVALSDEVKALIKQLTEQKESPLPDNLNASLRPYQHRGYTWMHRNTQIGFGSVIADDMGLGKTLQVITTLLKYKESGALDKEKAMVVVPTGLLTNWQAELEKFAPSLVCKLYHGTGRKLDKKEQFDILLTSYGVTRSEAATFKKMKWHVLIIDEAQNIKNHDTEQSKAVKSIPANTFIAMSGTPVENRLSELWSIMDFCNRGFLGSLPEFKETFANPIQNQNDIAVANKLKLITSPFMMRRLKSDKTIISDLPDKIEMDCYNNLTKDQSALYHKTLQKAMEAIEEIDSTDKKALFVRQGLVLQMIMALKQICNHPTQFLKNKVLDASLSGKIEMLYDKLESIVEANEKVLIFSQFTEMGELLKHFITERFGEAPLFYHGGCSVKQRKEMVETFQTNPADKIFLLSLKAAGTGLNLTAANHVIHYDLWWNPAVEAQATDRAYRIGQKSNVMVHRFITKGTFEERINEMIQSKKALANMTVATGENWIGNLSNKDLRNIFELG